MVEIGKIQSFLLKKAQGKLMEQPYLSNMAGLKWPDFYTPRLLKHAFSYQ